MGFSAACGGKACEVRGGFVGGGMICIGEVGMVGRYGRLGWGVSGWFGWWRIGLSQRRGGG